MENEEISATPDALPGADVLTEADPLPGADALTEADPLTETDDLTGVALMESILDEYESESESRSEQDEAPETEAADGEPNWYEKAVAAGEPDELAELLNEEAFDGLRANPERLSDWAQRAFGYLRQFGADSEQRQALAQGAEYAGGWDNARQAFDVFGDLLRGSQALEEAGRAEFPDAETYADRAFLRLMQSDPLAASAIGAAALTYQPDLLRVEQNVPYVLRALGLDPQYFDDYLQVVKMGGFRVSASRMDAMDWLKANNIPSEQLATFLGLPLAVQEEYLNSDKPNVARWSLQREHENRLNKERDAKAKEEESARLHARLEFQSAQTLSAETRKVFYEYVDKGKSLGLGELEALGFAALAYAEIEGQYWQDGTEARRVLDGWHGLIKGGNGPQVEIGRKAYRKIFESAYRKVAGRHRPSSRPGVPPQAQAKQPARNGAGAALNALTGDGRPQFKPASPSAGDLDNLTDPVEVMEAIMRRHGAI